MYLHPESLLARPLALLLFCPAPAQTESGGRKGGRTNLVRQSGQLRS